MTWHYLSKLAKLCQRAESLVQYNHTQTGAVSIILTISTIIYASNFA